MSQTITLQYLYDPLCGWCYGASATVAELARHPSIDLQPLATGLFAREGEIPISGFAQQAWVQDQRIGQLSGRVFSEDYRRKVLGDRHGYLDSTVATLALTAVAEEAPDRVPEVLKSIQEARYVSGMDVTSAQVVAGLMRDMDLAQSAQRVLDKDKALMQTVAARTAEAQAIMAQFHLQGVPSLIAGTGAQRRALNSSALYSGADAMLTTLGLV